MFIRNLQFYSLLSFPYFVFLNRVLLVLNLRGFDLLEQLSLLWGSDNIPCASVHWKSAPSCGERVHLILNIRWWYAAVVQQRTSKSSLISLILEGHQHSDKMVVFYITVTWLSFYLTQRMRSCASLDFLSTWSVTCIEQYAHAISYAFLLPIWHAFEIKQTVQLPIVSDDYASTQLILISPITKQAIIIFFAWCEPANWLVKIRLS